MKTLSFLFLCSFFTIGLSSAQALQVTEISPGNFQICRLDSTGIVKCWGTNDYDDGAILPPADLGLASSVQSGNGFSCALKQDSSVRCWGSNRAGQLNVPTDLGPVAQIAVGTTHSCALQKSGEMHCWGGTNDFGQLNVPANLGVIQSISVGWQTSCAIAKDGTPTCWGLHKVSSDIGKVKKIETKSEVFFCAIMQDDQGKCFGNVSVPKNLGLVKDLSMGPSFICSLNRDNLTQCWSGMVIPGGRMVIPEGQEHDFVSLASGTGDQICGIKANGHYACWGGQILHPPLIFNSLQIKDIAGNGRYYCGIDTNDVLHCWGSLSGVASEDVIPDMGAVKSVSVGDSTSCAIDKNDRLRCWGDLPKQVSRTSDLGSFASVSAASGLACAIDFSGKIQCWGAYVAMAPEINEAGPYKLISTYDAGCAVNLQGLLKCYRLSSLAGKIRPLPNLTPMKDVKVGYGYGCGVSLEGKLSCFVTDGNPRDYASPPTALGIVTHLSLGTFDACAVNDQHDLNCWAYIPNSWGYGEPIKDKVLTVVAGNANGCAITLDQKLKCWSALKDEDMD